MMNPAVLLDLGNVLVHLDSSRHQARLGSLATLPVSGKAIAGLPELDGVSRGHLSTECFLTALDRALGTSASHAELESAWCDLFTPWPEMEALASELVATGHATYLASNTDPLHFAYLRQRIPVLARLRGLHLSYEVGALKPERDFFDKALRRFALVADQCVFVDDLPDNVATARSLGIRSHVFTGDVAALRLFLQTAGVAMSSAAA